MWLEAGVLDRPGRSTSITQENSVRQIHVVFYSHQD